MAKVLRKDVVELYTICGVDVNTYSNRKNIPYKTHMLHHRPDKGSASSNSTSMDNHMTRKAIKALENRRQDYANRE